MHEHAALRPHGHPHRAADQGRGRAAHGSAIPREPVMRLAAAIVALTVGSAMAAETGTFTVRLLTPETALKAAQAALAKCRAGGFQVTVVVVDRSGLMQALLRDRFAAPHTIETARLKAQTAVNFRMDT